MSAKIFISYGEEDSETAKRLYDDLKASGFAPWMNKKNILPGQNRKLEIRQAIMESSYFLVLLSEKFISGRGYFQKELKTALEILEQMPPSDIFILPVRLDDCKPSYENLQDIQHTDLFPSYEKGFRQIVRVLESPEKESRRFVDERVLGTLAGIRIESRKDSAPSARFWITVIVALVCLFSALIFFSRPDIEQNIRGNGNTSVITGDGDVSISRESE
ncbi:MAG: toll/interleukin-1 receptor domain-containing protein [Desulfobacteraceae bacterium]|nr:toll/interleukin-1 receptor domain-containing protein [Desulfobacteraceae bacterium]